MKKTERNPISKALKALDWLLNTPESDVGVRQVANALALRPSNAHSLLTTLVSEGFVQQDPQTARYSLGPELLRWAHLIVSRTPIRQVAVRHMRALVDACNETTLLGLYDASRQKMMFAESVESRHPLRYVIELNKWLPLNSGASTLAMLAFLPQAEIDEILKNGRLEALTPNSIADSRRIKSELRAIRRRGFAFSRGQRLAGAVGIGAPIFGSAGRVIGDIVVTFPEQRFNKRHTQKVSRLVVTHAAAITADLGGLAPAPRD
jgi:DNA-binding IclR family transcriptional regulator